MINLSLPCVETTHALFSAKHYGCSLQAPLPHQAVPCESVTVADAPLCPSHPDPCRGPGGCLVKASRFHEDRGNVNKTNAALRVPGSVSAPK